MFSQFLILFPFGQNCFNFFPFIEEDFARTQSVMMIYNPCDWARFFQESFLRFALFECITMLCSLFPSRRFLLGLVLLSLYFSSCLALECGPLGRTITVNQSGRGDYATVQAAIDSIPVNNDQWIKIHIRRGIYKEKVTIRPDKGCIFLEGEGRETTIISWNDQPSTQTSPSFTAGSDNFVAKSISFENSYNLEEFKSQHILPLKVYDDINIIGNVVPAIAARMDGDKQAFYQCGFLGYQDTLLDNKGRHYFSECYIEGAVDFIFGDGQSFYEKCDINVTGYGYITAQARDAPNATSGFVFESCNVFGTGPTYLGRAYRRYSKVIYHLCTIDVDVVHKGWDAWHQVGNEIVKSNSVSLNEAGAGGHGFRRYRNVKSRVYL